MSLGDQPRETSGRYDGLKGVGLLTLMVGAPLLALWIGDSITVRRLWSPTLNLFLVVAFGGWAYALWRGKRQGAKARSRVDLGLAVGLLVAWGVLALAWRALGRGEVAGGLAIVATLLMAPLLVQRARNLRATAANRWLWLEYGLNWVARPICAALFVGWMAAVEWEQAFLAVSLVILLNLIGSVAGERGRKTSATP